MATKKKMLQAAAGNAGGEALNVEEVFSTYLYEGGTSLTAANGVNLLDEGGLVWIKNRSSSASHSLYDTERGAGNELVSDSTAAEVGQGGYGASFLDNGFKISFAGDVNTNQSGSDYASWTFRKAPKFFDVVTYTGDGVQGRDIAHNLGVAPGMVVVKRTDSSDNWAVQHRSLGGSKYLRLNSTTEALTNAYWDSTDADSSVFRVGSNGEVNASGATYVAYLFAHNDGDGGFNGGDIIKCGSFTTDSNSRATIDLGFEPQFLIWKRTDGTSNWEIDDVMRGWSETERKYLSANDAGAEGSSDNVTYPVKPTSTGFLYDLNAAGSAYANIDYIYIAIRRGTKVPESADEVFAIDIPATGVAAPTYASGFPVDMALGNREFGSTGSTRAATRLTGTGRLFTNSTGAESADGDYTWDFMDGYYQSVRGNSTFISWMWKRAPNFFDVVAYTGNGTAGRTVSHNLGVAPEMMWVKRRDSSADWAVYHSGIDVNSDGRPETDWIRLNLSNAATDYAVWNDTAPTATDFTLYDYTNVNASGGDFIAYLFASLDGVSKVGSYTGNGTSQTIDCGFTSGARFVLIKETSGTSPWHVFDTERGIVAGNDPRLKLDSTDAQTTTQDFIDPAPSGFAVTSSSITNGSGDEYIFYAIA